MPTVTWNSERRSSRAIGNSGVAASANGSTRGPMLHDALNEGGAGAVHELTTSIACEI